MKVSVIIPNYNHAQFLEERINSVLQQRFQDFEIILLDDCSTDDSLTIINDFATRYPNKISQVLVNETNTGNTFRQWEKGLVYAKGTYIWIAESDDVAEPTFLEHMVAILDANPEVNVAISNLIQIDEKGSRSARKTTYPAQIIPAPAVVRKKFSYGNYIYNASAAVFRKSATENLEWPLVQRFRFSGDWMFWVLLLKNAALGVHPEILCYHRYHAGNVSTNAYKQGLFFDEGLVIYDWVKTNVGIGREWYIYYNWRKRLCRSGLEPTRYKEVKNELRQVFPYWWAL